MTHYEAGRRFEWKVRDDLVGNGYEAFRSAGSKTKIDLVAFKQGETLLVQAKAHGGPLPPQERSALLRVAALVDAVPLHAFKPSPGRVAYRRLTGHQHDAWTMWTPDQVAP